MAPAGRAAFVLEAFDPVRMFVLLAVTSIFGFIIRFALALLWNGMYKKRA